MPEIGTSGLMSGDGKRGGASASVLAPVLDSTRICRVSEGGGGKLQITSGIGDDEALDGENSLWYDRVAPDQSVFSACFAKRANAVRDRRSILARTALSLRFCLVAA